MRVTVTSTSGRKLSYQVSVETIKNKMEEGRLNRKTLQMAALEHIKPSLMRRIPNIMTKQEYSVRFKGLYV